MTFPVEEAIQGLAAAADRLGAVDLRFVSIALAFQLANLVLRSVALRNVLAAAYPGKRISVLSVGAAYAAGTAVNSFTPARGGEAVKVALLRMRIPGSSVPAIVAAGSILLLLDAAIGLGLAAVAWWAGLIPQLPGLPAVPTPAVALDHPVAAALVALGAVALLSLLAGPLRRQARRLRHRIAQGAAILRSPLRYLRQVALVQLGAWACRIAVVFFLLAAFGLRATIPVAALVVVAGGLSTLVPVTPGGAGTQQALLVYVLQTTATTAAALSFSVGMQVGITAVNTLIGVVALMVIFKTMRPVAALRTARARAGGQPV